MPRGQGGGADHEPPDNKAAELSSLAQSELNTVASRFEMVNKVQYRFVEGGTEEYTAAAAEQEG